MTLYKHVLIATDLSKENQIVVEKGLAIAQAFEAEVSFLHVVEPLPGYGYAYVGIADIEAELQSEATKGMQALSKKYNIPADRFHIEVGPMKVEMIELVRQKDVDCLVVGSHGRHGLAELLGSTSHAAVHSVPCDVITVRIKND